MTSHGSGCHCDPCLRRASRKGAVAITGWSAILAALASLVVLGGCVTTRPPQPPPQPHPSWSLTATVIDAHTRAPIPGATVSTHTTDPLQRSTLTANAEGVAVFPSLPQAGYSLCARAPGYQHDGELCGGVTLTEPVAATIALTPDALAPPVTRLRMIEKFLIVRDGLRYRWRSATAFRVLDYLADGNDAAAEAFVKARAEDGFTMLRVLSTARLLFQLTPDEGRAALPRLFDLLRKYGLYVELVALADTAGWSNAQLEDQVSAIGRACAVEAACVVEVANEALHETQARALRDPAYLKRLRGLVPAGVIATTSSNCCGQDDETLWYPGGDYVVVHRDRSRDQWNNVRRVRESEALANASRRFVVDDEPIGADEVDRPGKRESDPAVFFTQGVLCRIFEVGGTFHSEAGLRAETFGPVQAEAARRFIEGTRIVPDEWVLTYKNAGFSDGPVKSFTLTKATRVYSGIFGRQGITIALGLVGTDAEIVWQNGWRPVRELARYPGVVVYAIERQ